MKVESNWFDELLKVTIYRDLLYRASIWTLFPLITLIINWRSNNYSAADYLMKAYASTMPALNFVFPVSTIMALIALYTKRRESISSPKCQNVKKFYHTFRRFTSDVLIWIAGALTGLTLLTFINFGILFYDNPQDLTIDNIVKLFLSLFILLAVLGYCLTTYVAIRKEKTFHFTSPKLNKGWIVTVIYGAAIAVWYGYLNYHNIL